MRDSLHLFQSEYELFLNVDLQLKHLESVWMYFERMQMMEEGTWYNVPNEIMDLYLKKINEEQKRLLAQFVAEQDTDALWQFLMAFKAFLEKNGRFPPFNQEHAPLAEYFGHRKEFDTKLLAGFPKSILVRQAAKAFYHCARSYQERLLA